MTPDDGALVRRRLFQIIGFMAGFLALELIKRFILWKCPARSLVPRIHFEVD
jgi:hypothetical protein